MPFRATFDHGSRQGGQLLTTCQGKAPSPTARALEARPARRLMKLLMISPISPSIPNARPNTTPVPVIHANKLHANAPDTTPRQVLLRPSTGCPSRHSLPPSTGADQRRPNSRATSTGAPLASTSITRSSIEISNRLTLRQDRPAAGLRQARLWSVSAGPSVPPAASGQGHCAPPPRQSPVGQSDRLP